MLQGLQEMQAQELAEVGRLTGLAEESPDALRTRIVQWIAKTVACSDGDPKAVERAALEWIAQVWKIPEDATDGTDQLEQKIRISIARDVAEHMRPAWALTCALVASGPDVSQSSKLKLLESTACLTVPSESARRRLFASWEKQCARFVGSRDVLGDLRPSLETLKARPDGPQQALSLALVISLADGRMSLKAEKLFHQAATEMGMLPFQASQLMQKLGGLFWVHHHDAQTKGNDQLAAGWVAAEHTLGTAGMLESLVLEAREELAGVVDAQKPRPPAWRRALGSLPGVHTFLSNKLPAKDQATLVRLVYLMILKQHALFSQEARQRLEEAEEAARQAHPSTMPSVELEPVPEPEPAPEPSVELPAPEPDTVPLESMGAPRRSIKL